MNRIVIYIWRKSLRFGDTFSWLCEKLIFALPFTFRGKCLQYVLQFQLVSISENTNFLLILLLLHIALLPNRLCILAVSFAVDK